MADKEPAQLPTDAAQVAYRSAAARLPAPDVGSGGQCTLQREGSVPPTPGLAAAQVASAFARLRSSSSSPRETDTSDSGRKSVDRPRMSKAYQHSPSLLSKLGACNGGLACGHSHAAAEDILMPHVAPAEQDSWGEPAAGDMQAALERSRKDTGGSRDGRSIDADISKGAAGSAADVKPGKGDGKGPSRHSCKGKERASAKTWTEMCAICMDSGLEISIAGCGHSLCGRCAYQLCARGLAAPVCPFCRGVIQQFEPMIVS
ncbi:hypothetical protein COCSUDRAFT_54237 [Coccomyxa subellipsoidea C-169]|uniref:RING-type domain-containing protein n=1 Tax=Coccomyxa subellipsoidea (strain C-169) TaxID=574566 RepID=I0YQY7_COCSC|nr:hypothetical protein COCSUDRAFT_54237 [Coccomyxa subellipsoidea C-169]EIE20806.1 hypothetical protein COCSUDRAFT_54237 [Coccomyxa subellipsoidea C-169]|eukprot:XP_005645350.1 hypothetical protein COCSUDRAFT_54237 [Coccomyxa subellipsoidea C-169]